MIPWQRPNLPIGLAGLAVGLSLGALAKLAMTPVEINPPPATEAPPAQPPPAPPTALYSLPRGAKPTLEQIEAARGSKQVELIWLFLEQSSLDELFGLLEDKERTAKWPWETAQWILQRAAALDPNAMLKRVGADESRRYALFQVWAHAEPEAAWRAAWEFGEGWAGRVLEMIAGSHPELALRLGQSPEAASIRLNLWESTALRAMADKDISGALGQASRFPEGGRQSRVEDLLRACSHEDAPRAWAWLEANPGLPDPTAAKLKLLPKLAQTDRAFALAEINKLPQGPGRRSALGEIAREWAKQDSSGAAAWLRGLSPGPERDGCLVEIIGAFHNRPRELLQLVQDLQWSPGREPVRSLGGAMIMSSDRVAESIQYALQDIAKESPHEALRALAEAPLTGYSLNNALSGVLTTWAENSPDQALAWLSNQDHRNDEALHHAAETVLSQWSMREPEAAARFMAQMKEPDPARLSQCAKAWSQRDPEAAWNWAGQLPEHAEEARIAALSAFRPEEAETRLGVLPEDKRWSAISAVADAWRQNDPSGVFGLLQRHQASAPDQTDLFDADLFSETAQSWTRLDPMAASRAISQMAPGAARDRSIGGMVEELTGDLVVDLESAERWAANIADESIRRTAMDRVATKRNQLAEGR